jgi:hypothetical protein
MANPSPFDTTPFSPAEILARLEQGRLRVERTGEGSRLVVAHEHAPAVERRRRPRAAERREAEDRRSFVPLDIPTIFPEKGPILLLVLGGFADDRALLQPAPFWEDPRGGHLIWQALQRAGLLHKRDADFALGRGGFWDDAPPRTSGLAMTYAGYVLRNEAADFGRVTRPWNIHRLQTLIQACADRSMGRLKVVTVGDAARFMACACVYGLGPIPVLSITEPTPEALDQMHTSRDTPAEFWIEWAANTLMIGVG